MTDMDQKTVLRKLFKIASALARRDGLWCAEEFASGLPKTTPLKARKMCWQIWREQDEYQRKLSIQISDLTRQLWGLMLDNNPPKGGEKKTK